VAAVSAQQVAQNYHGECAHHPDADEGDHWCNTHDQFWRPHYEMCSVMTDYIDLCEQAVEEYQTDLRAKIQTLLDANRESGQFGAEYAFALLEVLDQITNPAPSSSKTGRTNDQG
jgi:Uncharacterised protein family (UPF0184)